MRKFLQKVEWYAIMWLATWSDRTVDRLVATVRTDTGDTPVEV